MKDFIKWLGVNEKIAKLVVWIFIIMTFLILTNSMLESIGFPNYQINYDNLKQININKFLDVLINALVAILNFYTIIFLVFRIKDFKKIFKYSILYLFLNGVISTIFGDGILQVFIAAFTIIFTYFYSHKNKKYVVYVVLSLIFNTFIQGITYLYKVKFIDYTNVNNLTKFLLFSDYFIIMSLIILVKEIYLNKRSEKGK